MVTKTDIIEVVGMLCVVIAVVAITSWPWALGLTGLLLVAKATEMERRQ